jgi:hypothetical protein
MISKSLSTSEKRARLHEVAGKLAEFAQGLFPLLVAHSDDYGRLPGDLFTVKHVIDPSSPRRQDDFAAALQALDEVGLIAWYDAAGKRCIQVLNFDPHQPGLHRRTASTIAAPSENDVRTLDASERMLEEHIAAQLLDRTLVIGDFSIVDVRRQVRIGNRYVDIIATTDDGFRLVIEVKRQRVTNAAIDQVHAYLKLVGGENAVPVVIGAGLSTNVDLTKQRALIGICDASLRIVTAASFDVCDRHLTFRYSHTELNRTEQNGTEERTAPAAPPQQIPESDPDPDDHYAVITAVVTKDVLPLRLEDHKLAEVTERRCRELKIECSPTVIRKAIDSALFRYYRNVRHEFELPPDPRGIYRDHVRPRGTH